MKLVILITAALLATSRASNVDRHNLKFFNDISNQIGIDPLTSSKTNRNFVTITTRPADVVIHRPGFTLELTCEGIGSPAPNIRWFKNDIPIYEHDQESNEISFSTPSSVARVTSTLLVARSRDGDVFTCVIITRAKSARATTVVHTDEDGIIEHPERMKLIPREPHILTSYKIFIDTIGSKVVLPCKARGHPRPRVVWRNQKGNIVKNDGRIQVHRSGRLVFSSLRWSDMGEYTCEATNAYGSNNATTFVYPAKAG